MSITPPVAAPAPAPSQTSPDWVRISYASAVALRFKSGRFSREFPFGGINLLLSYDRGCLSDCGYCGLARNRPGDYEDKSFIRVEWPLVRTDELVDRLVRHEDSLTRLCISMVTHGRAYPDTLDITRRLTERVRAPLSLLVAPPTLNEQRLRTLKEAGADMIGIGLDAVTEELFASLRTNVPKGGLKWDQYWQIVGHAREIYGPWHVNCHTLVGLGESDAQLMGMFERLLDQEIFSYLFCFNPEPDSRLGDRPKTPVERWRRIQLAKFLLEERGLDPVGVQLRRRRRDRVHPRPARARRRGRPRRPRLHDQRLSEHGRRAGLHPADGQLAPVGVAARLPVAADRRRRARDPRSARSRRPRRAGAGPDPSAAILRPARRGPLQPPNGGLTWTSSSRCSRPSTSSRSWSSTTRAPTSSAST